MISWLRIVVDAGVAVKWYVPEERSRQADSLLSSRVDLLAPDLILPEIGNIIWKKVWNSVLLHSEAQSIIDTLVSKPPFEIVSSTALLGLAVEIAVEHHISVYDALYISTALEEYAFFFTADEKLVNRLQGTYLEQVVVALETG